MKLNREKIVAAFALVLLLSGSYKVLLGIITPAEGVKKPDITIPETRREIAKPVYRRFSSPEPPSRNPFSFAEGWRPLERLPLRPPPYPAMAQLLPLLGNSPPPGSTPTRPRSRHPRARRRAEWKEAADGAALRPPLASAAATRLRLVPPGLAGGAAGAGL
jgi:hypothetical protein